MTFVSKKSRVCVFPSGTEIGLEVFRALDGIKIVELYGANSVRDASYLLYKQFIEVNFDINSINLPEQLANLCKQYKIDVLIPAHDEVLYRIGLNQSLFKNTILCTPITQTCEILRFKSKAYDILKGALAVPKQFTLESLISIKEPVFLKPDNGQGAKGVVYCRDGLQAIEIMKTNHDLIATEFLPGEEYTIDCYTDKNRILLSAVARKRCKIVNGIAVTSEIIPSTANQEFLDMASIINTNIHVWGVWFFQVKRHGNGHLVLLEIANRVPGSYSLTRSQGFNGLEAQIYETWGKTIFAPKLAHNGTLYRHFACRVSLGIHFSTVYVDFDDTVIQGGIINHNLMAQLHRWRSKNITITLVTRHAGNLTQSLNDLGLTNFFHEIFHLKEGQPKADCIYKSDAIFIDDSLRERLDVMNKKNIPCFPPDAAVLIAD